jgi:predicted aspartyl protease
MRSTLKRLCSGSALLSIAVLATAPCGATEPLSAPAVAIAAPDDDTTLLAVPTRIDRIGRIVVPVMINGQGPFRFIVDTGASHSVVSPALAAKLGLTPTPEAAILVNGITGTAQVPGVTIAKLQAGDLAIEDTNFPVVWAPLMAGADGILGAAGLSAQRLLVDFDHNKVVLSRAGSGTPSGYARIPARRLEGGLVAVRARVGRVDTVAIIDTGSERTLGNLALRDALKQQPRPGMEAHVTTVFGATTEVAPGDAQVVPTIAIDQLRISDVTVVYGKFHIFSVWNLENRPALIIGMDILGTVGAMSIDFKHQYVYLAGDGVLTAETAGLHSYSMPTPGSRR